MCDGELKVTQFFVENIWWLIDFSERSLGRIQAVKRYLFVAHGRNEAFSCSVRIDKTSFVCEKKCGCVEAEKLVLMTFRWKMSI